MPRASLRGFASTLSVVFGLVATDACAQAPQTSSPLRGVLWTPDHTDSLSLELTADVRTRLTQTGTVALVRDRDLQNTRVADHGPLAAFDEISELCKLVRASFYVKVDAQPSSGGFAGVGVLGPCRKVPADTLLESGVSIPAIGDALTERIVRKVLTFAP
jgi:hypothetical protein